MQNSATTLENNLAYDLPYDPAIPARYLPKTNEGIYPYKSLYINIHSRLFEMSKLINDPISIKAQMDKQMQYTHTIKYCDTPTTAVNFNYPEKVARIRVHTVWFFYLYLWEIQGKCKTHL
jgi:hypothetical protein